MENYQICPSGGQCFRPVFWEQQLQTQSCEHVIEPFPHLHLLQGGVVPRSHYRTFHSHGISRIRQGYQGYYNQNIAPTQLEHQFQTPSCTIYQSSQQNPHRLGDPPLHELESVKLPPSIPEYYYRNQRQDSEEFLNGSFNQDQSHSYNPAHSRSDHQYPRALNQPLRERSDQEYYAPTAPVPEIYYRRPVSFTAPVADNENQGRSSATDHVPEEVRR